jgi:hypothetical protein
VDSSVDDATSPTEADQRQFETKFVGTLSSMELFGRLPIGYTIKSTRTHLVDGNPLEACRLIHCYASLRVLPDAARI